MTGDLDGTKLALIVALYTGAILYIGMAFGVALVAWCNRKKKPDPESNPGSKYQSPPYTAL